ncbi:guanine nucleotide-binding protein subunit beta-like protein [Phtheirospermum japonicum]|uniref:Guanine nucleotide-binding protein subunit beta-like protein n=1 Tax=Phtheirospermum japonicum TaxID=374723 RepID=A0A830B732_9LAMI|nr:guanine nucleotide-binding protein subunit beta-like protein [Phtheirospermum japonicum]
MMILSSDAGSSINALCFKPNTHLICAPTDAGIMIWDKMRVLVDHKVKCCTALNWSADGSTLFSGHKDVVVRAWGVIS